MKLKLLKKYFDDMCSPEEVKEVLQWIQTRDASKDLEKDFAKIWEKIKVTPGDFVKWESKLDKVHEKIEMEELYESLAINQQSEKSGRKRKDKRSSTNHTARKYPLRRKRNITQYIVYAIAASIIALFSIIYNQFVIEEEQPAKIEKIEKQTELGQKLTIHLKDGSKIILNAGSSLIYPARFDSNERKIELTGEAFFYVKKDTARPFRVVTGTVITTALGTSFNINAFPVNEKIEIALVSGRVSVEQNIQSGNSEKVILHPGELAEVLKGDNSIKKSFFDLDYEISWKDGVIYFKDASYDVIVRKLERWYGVTIHSNNIPVEQWSFSGKFENETLENVLAALQFSYNFEYEINEKEVKLKF